MTNEDKIRNLSPDRLARLLCDLTGNVQGGCSKCPAQKQCYPQHNGMVWWLRQEADDAV